MARVKRGSRSAALAAAFLCVMSGAGGFLGAIVGVVAALLTRTLLNLGADTTYLIAISTLIGAMTVMLAGIVLLMPRPATIHRRQADLDAQSQPEPVAQEVIAA